MSTTITFIVQLHQQPQDPEEEERQHPQPEEAQAPEWQPSSPKEAHFSSAVATMVTHPVSLNVILWQNVWII